MCVRACACYHSRGGIVTFYTLRTALSRYTLHFQLVDFELRSEVMASFATPQALYWLWHRGDVTIKLCYVMLAAIGVQHVQVAANIPAYGGREVQCRRRPTVGPTSLRHRADVAPTSLRRRADVGPTSLRCRSDIAPNCSVVAR